MSGRVGRLLESVVDWLAGDGRIYYFPLGGRDLCCPLCVVITFLHCCCFINTTTLWCCAATSRICTS